MASKQKVFVHLPWDPVNSVILCFDLICARLPSWASQKSRVFQLRFYWPFPTRAASHTPHYKQLNCKRECFSVANWNNIFLIKMHIHTRYISLYWVFFLTPVIPGSGVFLDKFMAAQMVKNLPSPSMRPGAINHIATSSMNVSQWQTSTISLISNAYPRSINLILLHTLFNNGVIPECKVFL